MVNWLKKKVISQVSKPGNFSNFILEFSEYNYCGQF